MKEGWLCPRCERINSPFINTCTCNPINNAKLTIGGKRVKAIYSCGNGFHDWNCSGMNTKESLYTCAICGQTKTEVHKTQ